ncbi:hypothetical protein P879_06308 [Paragonimus westermani]|uniref:mRNA-capping enzyme n=1 Tax=Paragonimus westermani TaxID=34504 RepID=A0A8T0DHT0_9TREM|nr:hypothetical protein P879_06308 [Paragonimus westermani]
MNHKGIPMLPPRWLTCPRMGDMILDIFIPFKTPLDSKFDYFIQPEQIFNVDSVFRTAEPYKLGLIVDLTKSKRFYNRREVTDNNCKYIKIECKGNEETPTSEQVDLFIKVVNQFLDNNPGEQKVGVHCTHGFNRTGFLIAAYLIEELNYGADIAVQIFADARPPGIYKADYLEDLFTRYGNKEDCPPAPPLPQWCLEDNQSCSAQPTKRLFPTEHGSDFTDSTGGAKISRCEVNVEGTVSMEKLSNRPFPPPPKGTPMLMEGVSRVVTLDQDCAEAHEARELADHLLKTGGCLYVEGQLVYADGQSAESDSESMEQSKSSRPSEDTNRTNRPLRFKGSQPVSISQRNMEALVNYEYCVSHKADGSRYLLLIAGPGKVYLIDRANFVYKPDVLHFPTASWVKSIKNATLQPPNLPDFLSGSGNHLFNTLLDGEMVLYRDPSKPASVHHDDASGGGTPRFLIYDIVTLDNSPVGRSPFFNRYMAIDTQVICPRNVAGHMGLVDFAIQSFSVRRKPFRSLNQTEQLLKPEFAQQLDHVTDGLIFQPCGPEDFYILGTCPQTLKWKPPQLNTIDFRCKIVHESKLGEIPGYVGYLYLGGLNVPSAKLGHVGPRDKNLDGKIVECSLVPGHGWKVLRVRTDKTEPNYHKSGVAIIESIMCPVSASNLLACIRQRGIKLSKTESSSATTSVK